MIMVCGDPIEVH